MQSKKTKANEGLLFETSWEVCNKVGGIYTVLSTKAALLHDLYGDNLVFIGPDVWTESNPSLSFVSRKSLLKNAESNINLPFGLKIRVGRWDIPGKPIAILVDFSSLDAEMNGVFGEMWEKYGVDSLHANGDYRESCTFAVASAIVMMKVAEHLKTDPSSVTAHFNEWTTGMGLLYTQLHAPQFSTVFTAHATCIGRSICGNGKPLYDYFKNYNGDQMAQELNMESKHSVEKAAANNADCFTAVSELTADECEQLLGKRPHVVTPNGFNASFVPTARKYSSLRKAARKRILDIASALYGTPFDDSTMIVATSGRNEYRNKGLDLYIDALNSLNYSDVERNILALILVPSWNKEVNPGLLGRLEGEPCDGALYPSFSTHRLHNEDSDAIFVRLNQINDKNSKSKVKFLYLPCYLDGKDGALNISYYDAIPAVDLTVFASYYEPWGYTPLESVAFSIPTVTTDKSGFGQWVKSDAIPGLQSSGVEVVSRGDSNYDAAYGAIAECVKKFSMLPSDELAKCAAAAHRTADMAAWDNFIKYYIESFTVAAMNRKIRNKNR